MNICDLTANQQIELQQRIEEAIAANDCEYTTEADIRYYETEEYLLEVAEY